MTTTYRIMGISFSNDRSLLQQFARDIESHHAATSPNLNKHAHHILMLGEMIGVRSHTDTIAPLLPDATREIYLTINRRVRPHPLKRIACRILGRFTIKKAVGQPREPTPYTP